MRYGDPMKYLIPFLFMISLASAAPLKVQYETYQVVTGSVGSSLKVTGKIIPLDNSIYIESARISGRVSSVLVKEGESISKGKRLLLINSAECLSLFQEKKMAKDRNLQDILQVVQARENQLAMEAQENACYLVASHGGVITKKMVEAGSNFNSGDN